MNFSHLLDQRLTDTYALLQTANLVVHPAVSRIVLHGSCGLAGGAHPDSDIDLSLIVDLPAGLGAIELKQLMLRTLIPCPSPCGGRESPLPSGEG